MVIFIFKKQTKEKETNVHRSRIYSDETQSLLQKRSPLRDYSNLSKRNDYKIRKNTIF